jgi:N-acetylneuraminate synthase
LGRLDDVILHGEEEQKALAGIFEQISEWGLKLPAVTPYPLHFGLGKFYETGETEFWIANEEERGYCGKYLFVFDGQTCPYHHHVVKHETFFVVKGKISMKVGKEVKEMVEGDLLVMPPLLDHSFTGIGPALILEVSMPSIPNDSFFENKAIGENGVL